MRFIKFVLLSLFFTALSLGQTYSGTIYDAGNPAYSVNIPVENGYINVANGNLHLEFPISQLPQRGALQLNERLVYDSHWWKIGHYSRYYWWPDNLPRDSHLAGGWRFVNGAGVGSLSSVLRNFNTAPCNGGGGPGMDQTVDDGSGNGVGSESSGSYYYTWTDPQGTAHSFDDGFNVQFSQCDRNDPGNDENIQSPATDSSGYILTATGNSKSGQPTIVIRDSSGNQVYPKQADRYGNFWSTDSNGNLIDDRGQTPVQTTYDDANHKIYFDVLRQGGNRVRYTITTVQITPHTNFGEHAVNEYPNGSNAQNLNAVQSILLPDGTSYSFGYEPVFGMMNSVTLPTGGIIQYGWNTFEDSYKNKNVWLTSRQTGSGANDPLTTFTPSVVTQCGSSQVDCHEKVRMRSPSYDATDFDQRLNNGAWNSTVYKYAWVNGADNLLTTTQTDYDFSNSCGQACDSGAKFITRSASTTTLADTSLKLRKEYQYNNGSLGTLSKQLNFDFFTGAVPAQPLSQTEYKYNAGTSVPADVSEVDQEDGAGNVVAKTQYTYTSTPAQTTSNLAGHDATLSANAYLQTSKEWADDEADPWHVTTYTMDDAGMVLSKQLSMGGVTFPLQSFTSDSTDSFITGSSFAYNGKQFSSSSNVDATTGLPNDSTDPNLRKTTYSNYDDFGRAKNVSTSDNASSRASYPSAIESWSYVTVNAGGVQERASGTQLDVFGRPKRSLTSAGQAGSSWLMQDTCYNVSGQVEYTSVPYLGNNPQAAQQCSGTHTEYDALGRVKLMTVPNGNATGTITYTYKGRATQVTDVNLKSKITQVDGLGRLTAVCEVTSSTDSGQPQDCGLDIAGTGFLTTYAYNLATHETTVTQGQQTRTFRTDSLGRPTYKHEPERSVDTTFAYGVNGTGPYSVRTSGAPNSSSHLSVSTATQRDQLNRVLHVWDNAGTGDKYFLYDSKDGNSPIDAANPLGRMTAAYKVGGAFTWFSYNVAGRVTDKVERFTNRGGNPAYDVHHVYGYDLAGNQELNGFIDPATNTRFDMSYSYDVAGNIASVSSNRGGALLSNVQYGAAGPVTYSFGNGMGQFRGYDSSLRNNFKQLCGGTPGPNCNWMYGASSDYSGSLVVHTNDTYMGTEGFMAYDDLNRLKSVNYPNMHESLSWSYDRFGNRNQQSSALWGATNSGAFQASNAIANASYSDAGNLLNGGSSYNYRYDPDGNVTDVLGQQGQQLQHFAYDAFNQRVRTEVAGGNTKNYSYDLDGRREAIWDGASSSPLLLSAQAYFGGEKLAYWDGGLAAAASSSGSTQVTVRFTNDSCSMCAGQPPNQDRNLHVQSVTVGSGQPVLANDPGWSYTNETGGPGCNHDGNLLCSGNMSATVSGTGPITVQAYGDIDSGVWPHMQILVNGNLVAEYEVTSDQKIYSTDRSGWVYQQADVLGTERMRLSSTGAQINGFRSLPFGDRLDIAGADGDPDHFAGLDRDFGTGSPDDTDHAQFRQYNSNTGRWMSPDPYDGSYDWTDPQSFNRYSYVENSPLALRDPQGLFGEEVFTLKVLALCGHAAGACATNPTGWIVAGIGVGVGLLTDLTHWMGLWGQPQFQGSLHPRPESHSEPPKQQCSPAQTASLGRDVAKVKSVYNKAIQDMNSMGRTPGSGGHAAGWRNNLCQSMRGIQGKMVWGCVNQQYFTQGALEATKFENAWSFHEAHNPYGNIPPHHWTEGNASNGTGCSSTMKIDTWAEEFGEKR